MTDSRNFVPFVSPLESPRELTVRALVIGSILGILFAASSVYLVLKVGLTVSASIPIAVLSITLFRYLGMKATILENNIVQTAGSAGESIAFGVGVTMPTLLLLGQDMEFFRVLLVALFGGLLGVLMMIPLRDSLIVREHGKLMYPEGTACADVLIVGEQGGTNAKTVFIGLFIGAVYKFLQGGLKLFQDVAGAPLKFFKGGSIAAEITPELMGVGYIIGPRISGIMLAGGILSYLVLIPAISIFGENLTSPMFPATKLIHDMSPGQIRSSYVLYIGAGAVATGGLISLMRSIPTIIAAFRRGFGSFTSQKGATEGKGNTEVKRTEKDLSMKIVVFGAIGIVLAIWIAPILHINFISSILILLFGFFFATVSSRICGEIGSSSNPISGMTVATLLITCLLFLAVGWTGVGYRVLALTTAAIVCVAAACAGTISQDLKTGYLVGATPRAQQIAIKVGVITSAIAIGWTLLYMNKAYTTVVKRDYPAYTASVSVDAPIEKGPDGQNYKVYFVTERVGDVPPGKYLINSQNKIAYLVDPGICGTVTVDDNGKKVQKFDSPKSSLFSLIIDGILTQKLPWGLVLIGVALAFMVECLGIAALPFAVGIYLPLSTSAGIMAGGVIRWLVEKSRKRRQNHAAEESDFSPGMLMASGLIAGGALMGVILAFLAGGIGEEAMSVASHFFLAENSLFAMGMFALMGLYLFMVGKKSESKIT